MRRVIARSAPKRYAAALLSSTRGMHFTPARHCVPPTGNTTTTTSSAMPSDAEREAKALINRLQRDAAFQKALAHELSEEDVQKIQALHTMQREKPAQPLTLEQTLKLFVRCAVPFFGFGVCDNLIMITVGDAIDSAFGVTLGFSTMIAAGLGQAVSDGSGITIQGFIENAADRLGLPQPNLTEAQKDRSLTKWLVQVFRTIGIVLGCLFGLIPVVLLDTGNRPRIHDQLLKALPEEARKELSSKAVYRNYKQGEYLMRFGEDAPGIITIVSGEAKVVGRNDFGEPLEIAMHYPGDGAGVVELVYGHKCVADVIVASPHMKAIVISAEDFHKAQSRGNSFRSIVTDFVNSDQSYVTYRLRYVHPERGDACVLSAEVQDFVEKRAKKPALKRGGGEDAANTSEVAKSS